MMKRVLVIFIGVFFVCFFLPSKVKAVEFPVSVPSNFLQSLPPTSNCMNTPYAYDCLAGGYNYPVLLPWSTSHTITTNNWNFGGYVLYMYAGGYQENSTCSASIRGAVSMLRMAPASYYYPAVGYGSSLRGDGTGVNPYYRLSCPNYFYSSRVIVGYYTASTGTWSTTIPSNFNPFLNPGEHIYNQVWSSLPVYINDMGNSTSYQGDLNVDTQGWTLFMQPNISHLDVPGGGILEPPAPPPPIGYIDEITGDWGTWDFFRDGINFLIRGLNGIISGLNTMLLWISDFFTPIFQWFADKIRDLFLPSEGFIEELQDEIDEAMNEKISITGFQTLVNDFKAGISTNSTEVPTVITGTIMGQQVTLVDYSFIYEHINIIRGTIQAVFAILIIVVVVPNLWNRFSQV